MQTIRGRGALHQVKKSQTNNRQIKGNRARWKKRDVKLNKVISDPFRKFLPPYTRQMFITTRYGFPFLSHQPLRYLFPFLPVSFVGAMCSALQKM